MTRVQLGYAYTDADGKEHQPDDVVDVDDQEARRLRSEGKARVPDEDQVVAAASATTPAESTSSESYEGEQWNLDELQREAGNRGLAKSGRKEEIAERLRAADRGEET